MRRLLLFNHSAVACLVLLFVALGGSVLAELDSGQQTQQTLADADEFGRYFPQLNASHFQGGLPGLLQSQGKQQTLSFYASRIILQTDANKNAAAIQFLLQDMSEDLAYQRLTALKLFLMNVRPVADLDHINTLRDYGANNLLAHFLTNIGQLDTNTQNAMLGTSGKAYRSLLLGLNALIVFVHNNVSRSSKMRLNHLSILDPFELKNFKGYILDPKKVRNTTTTVNETLLAKSFSATSPPPSYINWVEAGFVGPVLNQGTCGSCWAFTAIAVMESRMAIAEKGNLTSLSEQQLVSCSNSAGNQGCGGGTYEAAWDYVQVNGVVPDNTYPYVNANTKQTSQCNSGDTTTPVVTTTPYPNDQAPINNEANMMAAVAASGPIAISISTPNCFTQYSSGILTQDDCPCYGGPSSIDHAVTIVGYGTSSTGVNYWLVKNSWGPSWGTAGYVMLEMGVSPMGMCGLLTDPNYPKLVSWSPECQAANPPSYCQSALQGMMYSNINATTGEPENACVASYGGQYSDNTCSGSGSSTGLPVWAWVLIGIAIALGSVLLICLIGYCCRTYAPSDAWYNVFSKPSRDGYRLLSKEEAAAGKGPVPNSDPRAFGARADEQLALGEA